MGLFDTHAHYDDPRFAEDLESLAEEMQQPSLHCPMGVETVVNIGCDVPTSRLCLELAEKYPFFYAAVGIHPQDAHTFNGESLPALREMLRHPKAVAIGEVGLDYKYENAPRDTQKAVFREMMALAEETGYPIIIHDRDAHGDCFDIVREFPRVTGIFHSYSASGEMARQLVKRGWYISFSGSVTFKNARGLPEAAKQVPLDRLLVETDAPYLSPEPFRGKRNRSDYAFMTAAKLAELHGIDPEEMVNITRENARRVFRFNEMLQK